MQALHPIRATMPASPDTARTLPAVPDGPSPHARMAAATAALALAATLLAGCGQPVPPDKASYVGHWRAERMTLRISADGRVDYRRVNGASSTKISAPIQGFEGPHFDVGVGPLTTRFTVSSPPADDGEGTLRMTVDGVPLTRTR
jgi:hypothetical protein